MVGPLGVVPPGEQKHLFQNKLAQVWMNKYITDTDERVMFPSQLSDVVSSLPGVSVFINNKPGNIFFKLLGTRSPKGVRPSPISYG